MPGRSPYATFQKFANRIHRTLTKYEKWMARVDLGKGLKYVEKSIRKNEALCLELDNLQELNKLHHLHKILYTTDHWMANSVLERYMALIRRWCNLRAVSKKLQCKLYETQKRLYFDELMREFAEEAKKAYDRFGSFMTKLMKARSSRAAEIKVRSLTVDFYRSWPRAVRDIEKLYKLEAEIRTVTRHNPYTRLTAKGIDDFGQSVLEDMIESVFETRRRIMH